MHDEVGVRVLDGAQHLAEERHARVDREPVRVAPVGDRRALDELHREPGLAVRRDARVVEARDVRVGERGEDLALAREALGDRARPCAEVRELERHRPREAAVRALGEPHRPHAALAQRRHEPPGADAIAGRESAGFRLPGRRRAVGRERRRAFEPVLGAGGSAGEEAREQRRVPRVVA